MENQTQLSYYSEDSLIRCVGKVGISASNGPLVNTQNAADNVSELCATSDYIL